MRQQEKRSLIKMTVHRFFPGTVEFRLAENDEVFTTFFYPESILDNKSEIASLINEVLAKCGRGGRFERWV
jgi:hypothetical protein